MNRTAANRRVSGWAGRKEVAAATRQQEQDDGADEGAQPDAAFLKAARQVYVESETVQVAHSAEALAGQTVAHRLGPVGKGLDRSKEALAPSEAGPEAVVPGLLNFQQLQDLLRMDLATHPEQLPAISRRLQVAEEDLRRLTRYYRVPKRPARA